MKKCLALMVFCMAVGPAMAALVDDFQGYDVGLVRDVASPPWTASDGGTMFISIGAEDDGNQYLTYGWASGYRGGYTAVSPVSNASSAATLFTRVYAASDNVDHSFGLSDLTAPGWFGDFEVQMAILANDTAGVVNLAGRNGGAAQSVAQLNVGQWYNVWAVIDQTTNTYDMYLTSGLADATEADKIASGFAFRNGTVDDLVTFFAYGTRGENVRLDDIYLLDGAVLTNPIPEPATMLLLGLGSLAVAARRRK